MKAQNEKTTMTWTSQHVHNHKAMPKKSSINTSKRKLRRRVGFSDDIATHEVEHLEELASFEIIWYTKEEYDVIKQNNSHVVRLIKSGEFEENDEYSCRGLEHKLKEIFRQRRANKFNALNAVLEEQDRQITRKIVNPESISLAYQTVSVRCHESAHTIACRDYRFSLNYSRSRSATGEPIKSKKKSNIDESEKSSDKKIKKKQDKPDKKEKSGKKASKEKKKAEKDLESDNEEEEDEDHDDLSPRKKGKGGRFAKGARRMYRRMSM